MVAQRVFIIAEAGVNHNGSLSLAKKLVDAAQGAGADAVKFQTFKAHGVVVKDAPMAGYQRRNSSPCETQQAMLRRLELKYGDFLKLQKYCNKKGLMFLSTPHSEDAVDFLKPLVPMYKIGSGDLTNLPFLEKVAKKGKPIILSTGMATLVEVKEALAAIYRQGNRMVTVLHCITDYPCPAEDVNLQAMVTMREKLRCPVGYSDHTRGMDIAVAAVALGAEVIEKHFTLDRNMAGPDHKASLEPDELKRLVRAIRNTEAAMGSGAKRPTNTEKKIKKVVRKSIVAKIDISKGVRVNDCMIDIRRPGTGIEPRYLNRVVGRYAQRDIEKDALIKFSDLV